MVYGFLKEKENCCFQYAIYIVKNLQSGFVFLSCIWLYRGLASLQDYVVESCSVVVSLGHYRGEFKWLYNVFLTLFGFATDISNIFMRLLA